MSTTKAAISTLVISLILREYEISLVHIENGKRAGKK